VNDRRFLDTLSPRDTIAGMAEAVKVSLIRDAAFFAWMTASSGRLAAREPDAVVELVERCARLHLRHIATSGDPFEMGSARPLDFGHWAAHKMESLSGHRLRHGEAVAIGVALDTVYSAEAGFLERTHVEPVLSLLETLGFRLWDETLERVDADGRPQVLAGLAEFREHLGGELTVTLLRDIGCGIETHEIREPLVLHALTTLREREVLR
jgi:3-dehydroquinate synthase